MKKITVIGAFLLASCQGGNGSQTSGHFENQTEEERSKILATQPRIIEEHAATEGVMISLKLVSDGSHLEEGQYKNDFFGKASYAASIVKSGVNLIIATDDAFTGGLDNPSLSTFKGLISGFEDRVKFQKVTGAQTAPSVWARDWGPMLAVNQESKPVVLDFNYYSDRPEGDFVPTAFAGTDSSRLSVPVYNEGGNFMNNSRMDCLMTSRVSDANQEAYGPIVKDEKTGKRYTSSNYRNLDGTYKERTDDQILNDDEIKQYYKDYAGCKNVHIFKRMPNEGTGHIDMWAKFLTDDVVMINEIKDSTIEEILSAASLDAEFEKLLASESNEVKNYELTLEELKKRYRDWTKEIQAYLVDRRAELEGLGYTIVTVPMPLPQLVAMWGGKDATTPESAPSLYPEFVIRSYTNSLLIKSDLGAQVLIPEYTQLKWDGVEKYVDDALIAGYRAEVDEVYKKYFTGVSFIDSDDLISWGGAVHCTTMQIPAIESK